MPNTVEPIKTVQPPTELQNKPWHQLKHPINELIEKMRWYTHNEAISENLVAADRPNRGGYWLRFGIPIDAESLAASGWVWLRVCQKDTVLRSWESRREQRLETALRELIPMAETADRSVQEEHGLADYREHPVVTRAKRALR